MKTSKRTVLPKKLDWQEGNILFTAVNEDGSKTEIDGKMLMYMMILFSNEVGRQLKRLPALGDCMKALSHPRWFRQNHEQDAWQVKELGEV
jgi:hypothetical protein